MKEIELVNKRKLREKHYLQKDGSITAKVFDYDVHYKKNNKYYEIDNSLINKNSYLENKDNLFKVKIKKDEFDLHISKETFFMNLKLVKSNNLNIKKEKCKNKINQKVKMINVLDGIDFNYKIISNMIKEDIIIKNKNSDINKLKFFIDTNLKPFKELNGKIILKNKDENVFVIEKPFMYDSNDSYCDNIDYDLIYENNNYYLTIKIDEKWLMNSERKYPIVIDPTISGVSNDENVIDTFIYSGDTNDSRGTQPFLKVGKDLNNIEYRSLLKFNLPTLETGSQIINATMRLVGYPSALGIAYTDIINVHCITETWNENDANWNNMNNKYNNRIEASFDSWTSQTDNGELVAMTSSVNLTNLVKRWYEDLPNYGIMLKTNSNVSQSPIAAFYSKNNTVSGDDPKPLLLINYRNQNGVEEYLDYITLDLTDGKSYINTYNGNVTNIFNVGKTLNNNNPVDLKVIYNTNDVLLNRDFGLGKGWKFNYYQTIKEITIDDVNYLEYMDSDGTLHYFTSSKEIIVPSNDEMMDIQEISESNCYYDEDNLGLEIRVEDNQYLMNDKMKNTYLFEKNNSIGFLKRITDVHGNTISIQYNNNQQVSEITTNNNNTISISYYSNSVEIISPEQTCILSIDNNKLISINTFLGIINLVYNNNIISTITDLNGKKIGFDYHSQPPYRISNLCEYGINNEVGNTLSFDYKISSTSVIENNEKVTTITFNNYGNKLSVTNLKGSNLLSHACGKTDVFFDFYQYKNQPISKNYSINYIKNYLNNSSFENSESVFFNYNILSEIDSNYSYSGSKSLKINCNNIGGYIYKSLQLSKGKDYTFSLYIKNDCNVRISLSYVDQNNSEIEKYLDITELNDDFDRYDVSIYYDEFASSNLMIKIIPLSMGLIYLDDIQLEEGKVANQYNYIDNSDFSDGLNGWETSIVDYHSGLDVVSNDTFEVISLDNDIHAIKINMKPSYDISLSKELNISGHAGDKYSISFWYKNCGTNIEGDTVGANSYNNVILSFNYNEEIPGEAVPSTPLNPNLNNWQFFSYEFAAEADYESMNLTFFQMFDANELYITNIGLYKNINSVKYDYDKNQNLSSIIDLNNKITNLLYNKHNNVISISDPLGKRFSLEYDSVNKSKIIRAISNDGVYNIYDYDTHDNLVNVKQIKKRKLPLDDGIYSIRVKNSNKYLILKNNTIFFSNSKYNTCFWRLNAFYNNDELDYYTIRHCIINNKYINSSNDYIYLGEYNNNTSKLNIIINNKGFLNIIDLQSEKYIKFSNDSLTLEEYDEEDDAFDFDFELISKDFIEYNYQYSSDGNYFKSLTDSLLHKETYDIDQTTGLTMSKTDSNGNIETYGYNSSKQIREISTNNKNVTYTYNNKQLSKMEIYDKEYNINYDSFLNLSNIKVENNITLISYIFNNNNGRLKKVVFGNGDEISYEYDEQNRLKIINKEDDTYEYLYNSNANIGKIKCNRYESKYYYDLSQNITKFNNDNFSVLYEYDDNNNIVSKKYKYNNDVSLLNFYYDSDDNIIKIKYDSLNEINILYNSLGIITEKNIFGLLTENYNYYHNGHRNSKRLKSFSVYNNYFYYKYDKVGNITHIYKNNILLKKYYYDDLNQLVKEYDFDSKIETKYNYNKYGNIISMYIYELFSRNLIQKRIFEYDNIWRDKLVSYDGNLIQYDDIGNPIRIGNNVLTWKNGNELSSYNDTSFSYDLFGNRISKSTMNQITEYCVENDKIIFEKTGNSTIYYIRDNNELIGFIYSGNKYFYVKNGQKDIIGIIDEDGNDLVHYSYDSLGKIISIEDANGNDLSNNSNSIANINPFRYRSYYYDRESGLYYLKTRYYNPDIGRFISPDCYISTGQGMLGYNMYVYCNNNPINYIDVSGTMLGLNMLSGITNTLAKTIAKKIVSATPKAYKKVKEVKNELKKRFVCEVGAGPGTAVEVGVGKVKIGGTKNFTTNEIRIKNGKVSTPCEIRNNISIGANFKNNSKFATLNEISVPITSKTMEANDFCFQKDSGPLEFQEVDDGFFVDNGYGTIDTFIGPEINLGLGVGVHFKCGFDVPVADKVK